jgi:deoxyhypusine synthase
MPAFGAAFVRRIWKILDRIWTEEIPLIVSIAGPITVSNQHRAWLIPLLKTGRVAYLTVTDAICYHDGHDSLRRFERRPICEVPIEGFDEELREQGIIRVTDTGFPEDVLFDQDRFITAMLRRPEFQRRMTGTEFRHLLGKYYAAQEKRHGVEPGLLATCHELGIPVFVGAPGDGSAYLNHVKLWAMKQIGVIDHAFELDVAAEVFESCAYHYWGLTQSPRKQLAILILGGGVPKNFSLQPEPTLSQIFLLPGIRGYDYDVQIVGAPVTDGSLTSCKPAEAHTWGKVSKDALASTVESVQADYSMLMPFLTRAIIEKHTPTEPYRLYDRRKELVAALFDRLREPAQIEKLTRTFDFPLAIDNE